MTALRKSVITFAVIAAIVAVFGVTTPGQLVLHHLGIVTACHSGGHCN